MKNTALKNKPKETINKSFFQSPLFLGLLNLIPLILIILGTVYCGTKIYRQIHGEKFVLGVESNRINGTAVSVEDRLKQLKVVLERVDSETIKTEIVRLKSL